MSGEADQRRALFEFEMKRSAYEKIIWVIEEAIQLFTEAVAHSHDQRKFEATLALAQQIGGRTTPGVFSRHACLPLRSLPGMNRIRRYYRYPRSDNIG